MGGYMNMEEILTKIAKRIETKCGGGGCPCEEGCDACSYEDCLDRIVDWLKEAIGTEPFEEE